MPHVAFHAFARAGLAPPAVRVDPLAPREPSMTPEQAIAFVRKQKIVPVTDVDAAGTSFVRAVTGERVRGSWWGHGKGYEIFNLVGSVLHSGEAISVKLLAGKETLVHRSLWPAFFRVVTNPGRVRARTASLSAGARKLLREVEKSGECWLDELSSKWKLTTKEQRRALSKSRVELEKALLVSADTIHTDTGAHASVLRTWLAWAKPEVQKAAAKLSLEEAVSALRGACGGSGSAIDLLG